MASLPLLDGRLLQGRGDQLRAFAGLVLDACRSTGAFYLANPPVTAGLCERVLKAAVAFFGLPAEEKAAVHISKSPHFRGYSEMHNERDRREQVHFSLELPAARTGPEYLRLQGPNLWPDRLGEYWRATVLGYLEEVGTLGRRLLQLLAIAFDSSDECFLESRCAPHYLLMKLIGYHPQPANQPARLGVAPHCDWSWITVLLQNELGGLQVRSPSGEWLAVPPLAGTLIINLGELIEVATAGYLQATPHLVCNHSCGQPRVSVPVFVNPALSSVVSPATLRAQTCDVSPPAYLVEGRTAHVHRVLEPGKARGPFVFGESEWIRKGLGKWCHDAACLQR